MEKGRGCLNEELCPNSNNPKLQARTKSYVEVEVEKKKLALVILSNKSPTRSISSSLYSRYQISDIQNFASVPRFIIKQLLFAKGIEQEQK